MTVQAVPRLSTSFALALLLLMQALIAIGRSPWVDSPHRALPVMIPFIENTPVVTREKVATPGVLDKFTFALED